MRRIRDEIKRDLPDLVVREMTRLGYQPRELRRIVRAICSILGAYIEDGYAVRLPGVMIVGANHLKQRTFRSNLPNLRARVFRSRSRAKLHVEPEGSLKRCLEYGTIHSPDV